jgi:hypothetical protein
LISPSIPGNETVFPAVFKSVSLMDLNAYSPPNLPLHNVARTKLSLGIISAFDALTSCSVTVVSEVSEVECSGGDVVVKLKELFVAPNIKVTCLVVSYVVDVHA